MLERVYVGRVVLYGCDAHETGREDDEDREEKEQAMSGRRQMCQVVIVGDCLSVCALRTCGAKKSTQGKRARRSATQFFAKPSS